jgi:radical SAM/Cys-rich protein
MSVPLQKLEDIHFPALSRDSLEILQVNLGYLCNQECEHCHVNAGPKRKEIMQRATVDHVLAYLRNSGVNTLDLTGGAPEMSPYFRELVHAARKLGVRVIDRCNLTVLEEPGYEDLPQFLADHHVEITASLPCYLEENVDQQRGNGVYQSSIRVLQQLNQLGYGQPDSGLTLNLVYNPIGPHLPPPQAPLEKEYKEQLLARYGIMFNHLFTITNMPVQRFRAMLKKHGQLDDYMSLLYGAHLDANLPGVMCRSLISVDWQGYVYDCDFNQMLNLPLQIFADGKAAQPRLHLADLIGVDLKGQSIAVRNHCYGCTAGQGSSCAGALN